MVVKRKRLSQSSRAGLLFPVSRIHKYFKRMPQGFKRLSKTSSVYATAVLEYLTAEILELSGNACRDYKRSRITPRHILLAIANDEELHSLLKNVTIPGGGVIPHIADALIKPHFDRTFKDTLVAQPDTNKKSKDTKFTPKSQPLVKKLANKLNSLTKAASISKKAAASGGVNLTILSEKQLKSGQKLVVLQADIVNVCADAIVHPTNNTFYLGGEVGTAISAKGGKELRDEVTKLHKSHGNLAVGGVAISDAGSQMLCSKIIHIYSPSWNASNQAQCVNELDKAVRNILTVSEANGIKTLAIPSISSGNNGFPKQTAAETILRSINGYFRELKIQSPIKQVTLVLFDPESVGVYTSELGKLDTSN